MKIERAYIYTARIIKVTDGDTVVADVDLGFHIYQRMVLRLRGINAPEKRGETYQQGIEARDALKNLLAPHPEVLVETFLDSSDKYGRLLAILHLPTGTIVNQWMIEGGFAVPYMT